MFTGLVTEIGQILENKRLPAGAMELRISCRMPALCLGESIAVDGACLTVSDFDGSSFLAQLSPETVHKTIAGRYRIHQPVHLERALCLGDRLGGHIVTGHVDTTTRLGRRHTQDANTVLFFELSSSWMQQVVPKGSISIGGVSLTVNETSKQGFSVTIVPHTASHTTFGQAHEGQMFNLETDIIAKYIAGYCGAYAGRPEHTDWKELMTANSDPSNVYGKRPPS